MNFAKQKRKLTDAATSASTPSSAIRRCSICGRKLPAGNPASSCPVCLLRIALDPCNSGDRIRERLAESEISAPAASPRRFGHYEILTRPDGGLLELGHGAMGITFKAIDVNLRIPVALKVLNLRLFHDALARRRFFREARAAARVRHPNVASVYHLGSRGREIFYAMEFVEGETLENLIERSGRFEAKPALEIATQVAAGLAAVHKQHLVHRDIKPSNIIVRLEADSGEIAKIIDLGLAKAMDELPSETAISIPGAFAGTPGFASPEQFAGMAWEKGERLAKLVAHRRTLLVLDGLEPLQNPPGPQEGRVREPSLQALLRELAAFNRGLCVITTRIPVADIAEYERTSVLRRDLEQLSSDAGARLLRALGVKGAEEQLRRAAEEFSGHCLALTLLGSYLTDAYDGDVRCRSEVSARLAHDVRQGAHARKVMESYQTWFGEGRELSVLRLLVYSIDRQMKRRWPSC